MGGGETWCLCVCMHICTTCESSGVSKSWEIEKVCDFANSWPSGDTTIILKQTVSKSDKVHQWSILHLLLPNLAFIFVHRFWSGTLRIVLSPWSERHARVLCKRSMHHHHQSRPFNECQSRNSYSPTKSSLRRWQTTWKTYWRFYRCSLLDTASGRSKRSLARCSQFVSRWSLHHQTARSWQNLNQKCCADADEYHYEHHSCNQQRRPARPLAKSLPAPPMTYFIMYVGMCICINMCTFEHTQTQYI